MLKLRESILADIHTKHIRPRPRWQYVVLHVSLWCIGIFTVVFGSISFSLVILELTLPERAYIRWMEIQDNQWISVLPYLWSLGVILALTLGYFIFKQTGTSYRLRAGVILWILLVGSLVWGEILYTSRMVHWWEKKMQHFAPRYGQFREGFTRMIPRPEEGHLVVRVSKIETTFAEGVSPDNKKWRINIVCGNDECRERRKNIILQKPIMFQWKIVDETTFEARDILPRPKYPPLPWRKWPFREEAKFQPDNGSWKKGG